MIPVADSDRTITMRAEAKGVNDVASRNGILVQIYPTSQNRGLRLPLGERPLVIGREESCDLRIHDESVSRRHVAVIPGSEGFQVEDLGSTNGTFVNDARVAGHILQDGDYLRIGNCIFRFLSGSNVEAQYHEEIYRLTIIDALTEVHNQRYFLEFLDRELARGLRHQRPLALLLFDIDHFKKINDTHGHLCGDHTLREVARRVRSAVRTEELLARYGGEEFAVVLPETGREEAIACAERIRDLIAREGFTYDQQVFTVTVSLGITLTSNDETERAQELIRQADKALYEAKRAGRNCLRLYSPLGGEDALPASDWKGTVGTRTIWLGRIED